MARDDGVPEASAHYIGPALDDGRIDLLVLSSGLRGLGRLSTRVSYLMFGSDFDHRLRLDTEFRGGSIAIPLHFISNAIEQAEVILSSRGAQALAVLMGILGFGLGPMTQSLYKIFKKKQGRPLTEADDLARLLKGIENIELLLLIRIYNDLEVQAALREVLRPLRVEGITEFQTRRGGVVIDSVSKGDLKAADDAEVTMIPEIEEKVLDIEKAALLPHLAWHFADGAKTFDAKIHDVDLWARIAGGERFGFGDRMRVELHTSFSRDSAGRLTIERVIPKVIEVDHANPPTRLPWTEGSRS